MLSLPWSAIVLAIVFAGAVVSTCYFLSKRGVSQVELPVPIAAALTGIFGLLAWFQWNHVHHQSTLASTSALIAGFFLGAALVFVIEVKGAQKASE